MLIIQYKNNREINNNIIKKKNKKINKKKLNKLEKIKNTENTI
jgi:hypothetical protein